MRAPEASLGKHRRPPRGLPHLAATPGNARGLTNPVLCGRRCIGARLKVSQFICTVGERDFEWTRQGETLRPKSDPDLCLQRSGSLSEKTDLAIAPCTEGAASQQWAFTPDEPPSVDLSNL